MTPDELRAHLSRLGYTQAGLARRLNRNVRTVERWAAGVQDVPLEVQMLLRGETLEPTSMP